MANTLVKVLFQASTGLAEESLFTRTGGWSEAFWHSSGDLDQVEADLIEPGGRTDNSVLTRRANILPAESGIAGYRLQAYDIVDNVLIPKGAARVQRLGYKGNPSLDGDIPHMALMVRMAYSGQANRTVYRIGCLPDLVIDDGEYTWHDEYTKAVDAFVSALANTFGSIITIKSGVPIHKIAEITPDGDVIGRMPITGIGVDTQVKVRHSLDSCNVRRGGAFKVTAVLPLEGIVTIAGWKYGPSVSGTLFPLTRQWVKYDGSQSQIRTVVIRKVGGPFARYRGKSKKKAVQKTPAPTASRAATRSNGGAPATARNGASSGMT